MDWINPTGAKKVHSSIDKVYQQKNLERVWETVKAKDFFGSVEPAESDSERVVCVLQLRDPESGVWGG